MHVSCNHMLKSVFSPHYIVCSTTIQYVAVYNVCAHQIRMFMQAVNQFLIPATMQISCIIMHVSVEDDWRFCIEHNLH